MMRNIEPEKVIQEILLHELNLPASYGNDAEGFVIPSVYIFAPNVKLGKTEKLQVCIQSIGSSIVSNNNKTKDINNNYTEIQETIVKDSIQIDMFSRNNDARLRRYEVVTALHSIFAQQKQDEYAMRLFYIPSRMNQLNAVEGSAKIYRYSITVEILHKKEYRKGVDYYDKFTFNESLDKLENLTEFKIPDFQ